VTLDRVMLFDRLRRRD